MKQALYLINSLLIVSFILITLVGITRYVSLKGPVASQSNAQNLGDFSFDETSPDIPLFTIVFRKDSWKVAKLSSPNIDTERQPIEELIPLSEFRPNFDIFGLFILSPCDKKEADLLLTDLKLSKPAKIFALSPFKNTLTNFRAIEPRWLYALAPTEISKWSTLGLIFLEPLKTIDADFIVFNENDPFLNNARLMKDAKRRGLPIFVFRKIAKRFVKL